MTFFGSSVGDLVVEVDLERELQDPHDGDDGP